MVLLLGGLCVTNPPIRLMYPASSCLSVNIFVSGSNSKTLCPIDPVGWTYYFLLFPPSGVRHAWFPVISREGIYPIFTKFGMGVYWVNSLHGIAFGEDSSIAN